MNINLNDINIFSLILAVIVAIGLKEIIFDEFINPLIRKFFVYIGITKRVSNQTALNDLILDKKSNCYDITIYMKNKKHGEGRVLRSYLELLPENKVLPYPAFRQDMDGISLYIMNVDGKDLSYKDDKGGFIISYIPHSEIESIDYLIRKK